MKCYCCDANAYNCVCIYIYIRIYLFIYLFIVLFYVC